MLIEEKEYKEIEKTIVDLKEEKILEFFQFIYDRQLLHYNRNTLKLPKEQWTDNPILKKYKFCNSYRQLDKGTLYINKFINENNLKDDFPRLFLNVLTYRFFNIYEFFKRFSNKPLPLNFNFDEYSKIYDDDSFSWFSSAYLIGPASNKNKKYPIDSLKKHQVIMYILSQISNEDFLIEFCEKIKNTTPRNVLTRLTSLDNVGVFLAGQVLDDLCHNVPDAIGFTNNDWLIVGPGAKRGLEIMFGDVSKKMQVFWCMFLHRNQETYMNRIQPKVKAGKTLRWDDIKYTTEENPTGELTLMEGIQHSLCEYRKSKNLFRMENETDFRCKRRYY